MRRVHKALVRLAVGLMLGSIVVRDYYDVRLMYDWAGLVFIVHLIVLGVVVLGGLIAAGHLDAVDVHKVTLILGVDAALFQTELGGGALVVAGFWVFLAVSIVVEVASVYADFAAEPDEPGTDPRGG